MADVNVTQTYRINIETNKDFNKAINNLELLKKELSEIDKSISNLNYEPLSKLTTAMNRLAKIDIGKISANIRRLSNVDFGKLTDISRSMNGLNVTPLSQLINVINRIANLDLTKLDYLNYTFSKLGDVNFDGLRKFNEEIKNLDADKMYYISSSMYYISRSSKDSFEKLNGVIEQTVKGISEAENVAQRFKVVIDDLKSKIKELKEKNGFNFNLKNTLKGLLKEGAFMLRFIKYRIMNAITRAISTAFNEGIKSVYEWASITGNEFVGVMDRVTTSTFYAKNALGALGANILTALEPAIISVCNWLVKAVDLVSMFVAKITGQDHYLSVATKTFKSYGDAINGVNKALGTLAGFDEINNIGGSSSSAGGSTTGVDDKTFETVYLEDAFKGNTWLDSLALTLRDVFFDTSELNGEQIAQRAVKDIFGLIGLSLGGLKGALLGIGLSLILNSVVFNHNGLLESNEIRDTIADILTSLAGAWFGAAILTPILGPKGTIIGFTLGLLLSLGFNLANAKLEKFQAENNLPDFNNSVFDDFYVTGKNLGKKVNDGVNDGINSYNYEQIKADMIEKYGGVVSGVGNGIRPSYNTLGQTMTDEIKAGTDYDSVAQDLSDGINHSYDTVIWQAKDNGYSIGSSTSQNIANGIKDGMTEVEKGMMSVNGVMIGSRPVVDTSAGNIANDVKNRFEDMNVNSVRSAENMVGDVGKKWDNLDTDTKKKMDDIYRYNSMFNANVYKGTSSMANNLSLSWSKLWSGMKISFKSGANAILSNLERWINNFIGGINDLSSGLRSLGNDVLDFFGINYRFGEIGRISLPRLATGTNYVPQDTLAMLHQGEAVVPKKFNSEEFFGGDSEETNELLRELISVVRKKNFSITKKEVGEASVDYIRSQTRLKGASVI